MRQTNVFLNRVFKVYVNLRKICILGTHANFCAHEKSAMKIEIKKQRKKEKNDGRFIQGDQVDESGIRNY